MKHSSLIFDSIDIVSYLSSSESAILLDNTPTKKSQPYLLNFMNKTILFLLVKKLKIMKCHIETCEDEGENIHPCGSHEPPKYF